MCGIAGIYPSSEIQTVEQMIHAQAHRGPDGMGIYQGKNITLGQNRLAIVDETPHDLPFRKDNLVIVFNGEITNYIELKKKLNNYKFETQTDTEVLLAAYTVWGPDCIDHLEGMFAFFIWDEFTQEGFAARDPVGVKPFFFFKKDGKFIFASEIQAILKAIPKPGLNEEVVVDTLIAPYFSGALNTPFKGIEVLPPGSTVKFQSGKIEIKEYFHFRPHSLSANNLNLNNELIRSIKDNLRAYCHPGLFLSGGLDSSLLATQTSNQDHFILDFVNQRQLKYDPSAIVNSYDTDPALEVSRHTSGKPHIIESWENDAIRGLKKAIDAQLSIVTWPQESSQQILAEYASQHCRSVLVGDAADETHFGYFFLLKPEVCKSPENILNWFGVPDLNRTWRSRIDDRLKYYEQICRDQGYNWKRNPELAVSYLISRLWLGRLLLNGDLHTMQHSLEARVPFANRNVLNVAQSLSIKECFEKKMEKAHLRKIAAKHLPSHLVQRKKSALPFYQKLNFQNIFTEISKGSVHFLSRYLDLKLLMQRPEPLMHFRVFTLAMWYEKHGRHYE